MTNEDILRKAIEKALKNKPNCDILKGFKSGLKSECRKFELHSLDQYHWIFDHRFAKAFWGEELVDIGYKDWDTNDKYLWGIHLKNMVLEDNPIKYLEKFI